MVSKGWMWELLNISLTNTLTYLTCPDFLGFLFQTWGFLGRTVHTWNRKIGIIIWFPLNILSKIPCICACGFPVLLQFSPGTELRGKNLVASRASKFKKLLALTKIQWPSIIHKNALVQSTTTKKNLKTIWLIWWSKINTFKWKRYFCSAIKQKKSLFKQFQK